MQFKFIMLYYFSNWRKMACTCIALIYLHRACNYLHTERKYFIHTTYRRFTGHHGCSVLNGGILNLRLFSAVVAAALFRQSRRLRKRLICLQTNYNNKNCYMQIIPDTSVSSKRSRNGQYHMRWYFYGYRDHSQFINFDGY